MCFAQELAHIGAHERQAENNHVARLSLEWHALHIALSDALVQLDHIERVNSIGHGLGQPSLAAAEVGDDLARATLFYVVDYLVQWIHRPLDCLLLEADMVGFECLFITSISICVL